jgi:hypothetical protein
MRKICFTFLSVYHAGQLSFYYFTQKSSFGHFLLLLKICIMNTVTVSPGADESVCIKLSTLGSSYLKKNASPPPSSEYGFSNSVYLLASPPPPLPVTLPHLAPHASPPFFSSLQHHPSAAYFSSIGE